MLCQNCRQEPVTSTVTITYPFGKSPSMFLGDSCVLLASEHAAWMRDGAVVESEPFIRSWMRADLHEKGNAA